MSELEDDLLDLAEGLREYNVPAFYREDLRKIADKVGDLEWRMNELED